MEDGDLVDVFQQLVEWHARKVKTLNEIADMSGPFTLKTGDQEIEMNDRDASLFRAGMQTVLMEIGRLPITVTRNDEEPPL